MDAPQNTFEAIGIGSTAQLTQRQRAAAGMFVFIGAAPVPLPSHRGSDKLRMRHTG
ncbi:MAG: hypothetical protein KME15_19885 [Drouetiella hepatica Uher 2000/2452]|uniref:Uncharacterized protein n=1 Tax=Drouetiella hepatica Uher 2000/2452 TaxID=904376 RepID=A0A951QCW2_9CYAN|nr:hypothetical protein [Drouetiella hepatica Uher 2000/2452]